MTPEGTVKHAVKKVLDVHGVYYHMPVQNGMGAPTLDFICCCCGLYLAIETKAPGKVPTTRQERTIEQILASRGEVFVVDGPTSLMELTNWIVKTNASRSA